MRTVLSCKNPASLEKAMDILFEDKVKEYSGVNRKQDYQYNDNRTNNYREPNNDNRQKHFSSQRDYQTDRRNNYQYQGQNNGSNQTARNQSYYRSGGQDQPQSRRLYDGGARQPQLRRFHGDNVHQSQSQRFYNGNTQGQRWNHNNNRYNGGQNPQQQFVSENFLEPASGAGYHF
ncbi:GATA zinc finger domain-containing protein 24-like [Lucilia cuprina]|uniref:GATA zinc finger domain-containing protein 24-like n=1 Tax=Lucilia cuprina TaxID=7375 RepID=UPI001F06AD2C|nr:GATA zinc finger domain-containing protein 24-like [Lucilia cuprina]